MLSKNSIFSYIFLFLLFPGQILSCEFVKFVDEFAMLLLFVLAALDYYKNGVTILFRLKPLWILLSIGIFYIIYSIVFVHFNTPAYVLSDFVSQVKPFATFFLVYCLDLQLTQKAKDIARYLCILNAICLLGFFIIGGGDIILPFGHIVYYGGIMFLSALVFLFGSIDDQGKVSQKDLLAVVGILALGLLCTRSKYYGEFLVAMTLLFAYRPGIFSKLNLKIFISCIFGFLLLIAVAWSKISYYFIEGGADIMSGADLEEMSEAFARPILFYAGGLILLDFIPFGCGLASFASNASATNYSNLYYDYGLDKVYGLSTSYSSFIADAYYPTLCQFGFFGIALFIFYWYWILKKVNRLSNELKDRYRYQFVIGFSILAYVLIESVGSTLFIQGVGLQMSMLLALLITGYERRE